MQNQAEIAFTSVDQKRTIFGANRKAGNAFPWIGRKSCDYADYELQTCVRLTIERYAEKSDLRDNPLTARNVLRFVDTQSAFLLPRNVKFFDDSATPTYGIYGPTVWNSTFESYVRSDLSSESK